MKLAQYHHYKRHLISMTLVAVVVGIFLAACGTAQADTATVGVINLLPTMEQAIEGFKTGLADSGYTEGENITYIYGGATGNVVGLEAAASELMAAEVDLIFAITTPASLAAQQAAAEVDVPVVFVAVTDPVAAGLVQELSKPGGNATGITVGARDSVNEGRRLEWLLQTAPDVEQVYIPYNPDDPVVVGDLAAVQEAAAKLGVELVLAEARTGDEAMAAINTVPEKADAIFVLADRVVVADLPGLVEAARAQGLPLSTPNTVGPEGGALMSYGSDLFAVGEQAARLANQIFTGVEASNLPVEAPEFYLTVNLKTAEAIDLDISDEILRQADNVIR